MRARVRGGFDGAGRGARTIGVVGLAVLHRWFLGLLLPIGLIGCASVPAAPDAAPAAAPQAPMPVAPAAAEGPMESARESVRSATEWLARGIDSWFGDRPLDNGGLVRSGRLGLRLNWRQGDGVEPTLRFNAHLDLPNLRERAFVFIGRDNERELVTDRPDQLSRQERLFAETRQEQSFFAGLGLGVGDAIELRAGIRRGYRLYTQARYRKLWPLGEQSRLEFRETVFWTISDGFGSTTALSAERAFSPSLALRWLNAATVSQKTDGMAWSSSLGLFKLFGADRLLSGEAIINGETGKDVDVSEYGLRAAWQQPVYRDWLIGELIVGRYWPRESLQAERSRKWAVGVGAKMRF